MKWILKLAIVGTLLMPSMAMAESSTADQHANSNAEFNRDAAPLPIIGAGLPAFGLAGAAYWLFRRRRHKG